MKHTIETEYTCQCPDDHTHSKRTAYCMEPGCFECKPPPIRPGNPSDEQRDTRQMRDAADEEVRRQSRPDDVT